MNNLFYTFIISGILILSARAEEIMLNGEYNASSELTSDTEYANDTGALSSGKKYGVRNLFDNDLKTAWVEGVKGYGRGEYIYTALPPDCRILNIFNGYGKSRALYRKNSRPAKIKLTCYAGINPEGYVAESGELYVAKKFPEQYYINLEDKFEIQSFAFPFPDKTLTEFRDKHIVEYKKSSRIPVSEVKIILKIEISEVYKGTEYDDTCISEIFFNDKFIYLADNPEYALFKKLYIDDKNPGKLMIDIPGKKGNVVLEDKDSVFQIAQISKDRKWASIISMPAESEGRVETSYILLNISTGRIVNDDFERMTGISLFSFILEEHNSNIFLEESGKNIRLLETIP